MTAPLTPPVDVLRSERGFHLTFDLPGVAAEDLDLTVEGGHLRLQATDRRGRSWQRAFELGDDVDSQTVEASLKAGVLTVDLPFAPASAPRRIPLA
jgi:HSP20 family protein